MSKATDVSAKAANLFFLPVRTRVPLKFGSETLTEVTCARACLRVEEAGGRYAVGWGETPLSVQWVWPSTLAYEERHDAMKRFTIELAKAWAGFDCQGHPLGVGHRFTDEQLPGLLKDFNASRRGEAMPWLAALVCSSPFDIALHDAYGIMHGVSTYATYSAEYMNYDLSEFLTPGPGTDFSFEDRYPEDYLVIPRPDVLPAWHLVGGKDWIDPEERDGSEPADGYPVLLRDWIRQDMLKCLKVKLRGNDAAWDFERLLKVGTIAIEENADWLSADFNCTVTDPAYVNDILDRLVVEHPRIYGMLLYVEQPFPYDLEKHRIDVHSVSARKPLFMDESAHDWRVILRGREMGWTGVALKTCKTQTGALLSLCWAKAHGMTLMVQDLTNPMLAQIPHVLLAAHAGTIMGVETNSMQFYPDASLAEAAIHPGIYRRFQGVVNLESLHGPGFGYRVSAIDRETPAPAVSAGG